LTAVARKQEEPWTYGMLANDIWSFAGRSDKIDVDSTFLQSLIAQHHAERLVFHTDHREYIRMGTQRLVGADQLPGFKARKV
jgi:hypothetical protein